MFNVAFPLLFRFAIHYSRNCMSDCAKYCGKKRSSGTVCEKYSGLYTEQKDIELISTREIIKGPKVVLSTPATQFSRCPEK